MQRGAADIGGTFTDLVSQDDSGRVAFSKVLTTPEDHAEGVMPSVAKAALDLKETALFLHGSTIAINTAVARSQFAPCLRQSGPRRGGIDHGRAA